jgi:sodium/proline symporter
VNPAIVSLVLYFAVVLGIGVWAMRKGAGENLEGYLLGGRKLGPLVTALTLQSTSMSGFMFLGAGALGYTEGYWALWYAAGDIGGGVVNLSVIGRRMRKLSQLTGSLTPIEYLEKRYPSPAIRLFAGGLTVFLLGAYVLAQFIAGGKGMALVTGMPYSVALLLAVGLILTYTYLGGYLAVAYTDFFQSLVMIAGVLWILAAALFEVGGLTAANRAIGDLEPSLLTVWGRDLGYQGQWGIALGAVLIFSVGYMGWPHVVTRHMAMRSPGSWRSSSFPTSPTRRWRFSRSRRNYFRPRPPALSWPLSWPPSCQPPTRCCCRPDRSPRAISTSALSIRTPRSARWFGCPACWCWRSASPGTSSPSSSRRRYLGSWCL